MIQIKIELCKKCANFSPTQDCCKHRVLQANQQKYIDQNGNEASITDQIGSETPSMMLYSMENPPKLSAEKRRDHLHLLRRRKSRARFLKPEEQIKLINFRRFFAAARVDLPDFVGHVRAIRDAEQRETYDENGVSASDGISR